MQYTASCAFECVYHVIEHQWYYVLSFNFFSCKLLINLTLYSGELPMSAHRGVSHSFPFWSEFPYKKFCTEIDCVMYTVVHPFDGHLLFCILSAKVQLTSLNSLLCEPKCFFRVNVLRIQMTASEGMLILNCHR